MPRDFRLLVEDILSAALAVQSHIRGFDSSTFLGDRKTTDAVLYNLTVIGEAASKLPQDVREREPGVVWRNIVALRNVIVHDYFGINMHIIWDVCTSEIQPLIDACHRLLALPDDGDPPA